jgi:hypothetical protein
MHTHARTHTAPVDPAKKKKALEKKLKQIDDLKVCLAVCMYVVHYTQDLAGLVLWSSGFRGCGVISGVSFDRSNRLTTCHSYSINRID